MDSIHDLCAPRFTGMWGKLLDPNYIHLIPNPN